MPTNTTLRTAPKLLDQVREKIRYKHYSRSTEKIYVGWIRQYILFHGKHRPVEMGAAAPTLPNRPRHIRCGIHLQRICCRVDMTFAQCRNYWGMRMCQPQ